MNLPHQLSEAAVKASGARNARVRGTTDGFHRPELARAAAAAAAAGEVQDAGGELAGLDDVVALPGFQMPQEQWPNRLADPEGKLRPPEERGEGTKLTLRYQAAVRVERFPCCGVFTLLACSRAFILAVACLRSPVFLHACREPSINRRECGRRCCVLGRPCFVHVLRCRVTALLSSGSVEEEEEEESEAEVSEEEEGEAVSEGPQPLPGLGDVSDVMLVEQWHALFVGPRMEASATSGHVVVTRSELACFIKIGVPSGRSEVCCSCEFYLPKAVLVSHSLR